MSIIRIINGRQAIPVWSIPYVCHLGVSLSAGFGDFLRSLAHKKNGMIEPDFITAYLQDENGAVVPISNNEWKGLLKDVNNEEGMRMETEGPLNVPYYSWRESSAIITPTQAFVYIDELSRWYYEAHKAYIDYDKNIWVIIGGKHEPIPYRREDYPLILDPIIPKKVLKKHGEWFEACNFQGQGGASPEPGQATGGVEAGNRQGQDRVTDHGKIAETGAVVPNTSFETLAEVRSELARQAANARHDKPGGSRDKRRQIREIWASGKYTSRDICAEQECAGLEMSLSSARKALTNEPNP